VTATQHDYRGYVFRIEYQAKDPVYVVEFADFPEIITSGPTLAGAFANACEALDLHLESLQKLQKRMPRPKHTLWVQETR
jgi:predicted RNase H-like HicB family nuclease